MNDYLTKINDLSFTLKCLYPYLQGFHYCSSRFIDKVLILKYKKIILNECKKYKGLFLK